MPDDLESDIQATAQDIAADAEALEELETEKATLDTSHPRLAELAARAERLARGIVSKTAAESELVAEAKKATDAPKTTDSQ